MKQEKKNFYLNLFQQEIIEKPQKIKELIRSKTPSSAGIIKVGKEEGKEVEEEVEQTPVKKRQPSQRRTRKSSTTMTTTRKNSKSPSSKFVVKEIDDVILLEEEQKEIDLTKRQSSSSSSSKKLMDTPTRQKFFLDMPALKYRDADSVLSSHNHHQSSSSSSRDSLGKLFMDFLKYSFILLVVCVVIFSVNYSISYKSLPYCASSDTSSTSDNDETMLFGWAYPLPKCKPCPQNALCSDYEFIQCNEGYLKKESLLFWGLIECVPDLEKTRNIEMLQNQIKKTIDIHAGLVACGDLVDESFISEYKMKELMKSYYFTKWDNTLFESYWNQIVSKDSRMRNHVKDRFYSFDPVYPTVCRMLMLFGNLYNEYKMYLVYAAVILVGILGLVSYIQRNLSFSLHLSNIYLEKIKYNQDMEMYVGSVVEILQKQDADYMQGRSPIAGIPCEQLRDYLLAKIKSKARRDKLWKDVERQVLELSSVTTCAVLIRGEQFDALQYVGFVRKED